MTYWHINEADLEKIGIGVGILGTGGGGSPYLGLLMARAELRAGRCIDVVQASDLHEDALVLPIGGIGAPTVGSELMDEGNEGLRLVAAIEGITGQKIQAVMADEIGGANGLSPMVAAARLGLPVVDADGMGRAFPEVQMTSLFINGQPLTPCALTDAFGNTQVITQATSPRMLEKLMRAGTVAMGCSAYMCSAPIKASFVMQHGIPLSISRAWQLGDAVIGAQNSKQDPVDAVLARTAGQILLRGKVTDIERSIEGGFVRGKMTVAGLDGHAGRVLTVDIQNEFLVAYEDGAALVTVPDLISVLDTESGRPISTEDIRYGQRASVIAMPCSLLLRTPEALCTVGPSAFGYDLDFVACGDPPANTPSQRYKAA